MSHNKVGEVRQGQGDLAGALQAYQAGLDIRERLAAADPGNAGWQRDLVVSFHNLATTSSQSENKPTAQAFWHRCHQTLLWMKESGMYLDPLLVQLLEQMDSAF